MSSVVLTVESGFIVYGSKTPATYTIGLPYALLKSNRLVYDFFFNLSYYEQTAVRGRLLCTSYSLHVTHTKSGVLAHNCMIRIWFVFANRFLVSVKRSFFFIIVA